VAAVEQARGAHDLISRVGGFVGSLRSAIG
jgi:hypothetical protein